MQYLGDTHDIYIKELAFANKTCQNQIYHMSVGSSL